MSLSLHYSLRGAPEVSVTFPKSATRVLVGSGAEPADIYLRADAGVAPRQAQFRYWLGAWWVENLSPVRPLYLGGEEIAGEKQLRTGDVLAVGGYVARVEIRSPVPEPPEEPGTLGRRLESVESQPPRQLPPDEQLQMFVRVSRVAAHARTTQSKLEGFLRELSDAFPAATRSSILLVEDREMVVRASSPEPSTVSFTLAREAIQKREAFLWQRSQTAMRDLTQLDTLSAQYAPMLSGGRPVGVVKISTHLKESVFTEHDLQLLSVIANTMGPALDAGDGSVVRLPQVFMSYAHRDGAFVNRLVGDLRRRQVKVWFDERIQTGEPWRRELAAAINSTDCFAIVLSPQSVASEVVRWELETAMKARKHVVPLLYEPCRIPVAIRPLHYKAVGGADEERGSVLDDLAEELRDMTR